MGEFFLFVLILLGAVWGSAFLYVVIRGISKRLEITEADEGGNAALMREELASLAGRLERVEEELEFYKRLKAPDEPEQ